MLYINACSPDIELLHKDISISLHCDSFQSPVQNVILLLTRRSSGTSAVITHCSKVGRIL